MLLIHFLVCPVPPSVFDAPFNQMRWQTPGPQQQNRGHDGDETLKREGKGGQMGILRIRNETQDKERTQLEIILNYTKK